MLESLFIKVADLKACNFTEKRLQPSCFPVNIAILKHLCWSLFLINCRLEGLQVY